MITLMPTLLRSQVVVGTGTPNGSALLEVQGTTGGVLFPRMTQTQRDAIASPATGLMLYNTTSNCLEVNVGTPTAVEWARVNCLPGTITTLDCAGATVTGSLTSGQAASGVSASVPYTGGDGGAYSGQTVTSTGVTGLTATLSAGDFASGAGNLTYAITGTPASGGTASFALNMTCTLDIFVCGTGCCAKVSATEYKNFMCYNLGSANTSADPFTPTWEINGGYWQWGRKDEAAAGPTATDPKDGAVSGWNTTTAPDGSWDDGSKTANDPCPVGYRIPTKAQWAGVLANNTKTSVGAFSYSNTNYGAGKKFGNQLMLPAAGIRASDNGFSVLRGSNGNYWSSTGFSMVNGWFLEFSSSNAFENGYSRTFGLSVRCVEDIPGSIGSLNCGGSTITGILINGQSATGVGASVPYTGGNGGFHSGQTVASTGVTGLTATLSGGSFASGVGNLSYAITGTPASVGTASFALSIGGQTCSLNITVLVPGSIGSLNCGGSTVTGSLANGQSASGVSASVPYTGGNGGFQSGQTVTSTGVTGLTATLSAGNFASGAGSLSYAISGTPAGGGTASFALNIGGQTCTLDVPVAYVCRAKVNATDYMNFMCYNLGSANTSADPFTPTWEINGGYWQWGRSAEAAAGPTGSGAGQANDGTISGWNTTNAPNGSWADGSKTANDPCPAGYRVPTKAQWEGVRANNTITNVGTFNDSPTNYGVGKKFGDQLMLPAAGSRSNSNGALVNRGYYGYYWSSTEYGSNAAWLLIVGSSVANTLNYSRTFGLSVRCVEDIPGSIGSLNCGGSTVTGSLANGQSATGVSASVPYTGGDGGFHSGQTVTSTGVTGLTATLSAGNFASGAGNLTYGIIGTPASDGTASFALNIGGQTCTLDVTVSSTPVCRAKVNATDYKNFMCYNLGAANTSADPFTPSWEINGGYWQWGRSAQVAAGPTGPDAGQANNGAVSGWNTTYPANGSWADGSKTANDPCPAGYRIPTKAQWGGVSANNTYADVGTFTSSATNYGSGKKFGDQLMLPAAGGRNGGSGALYNRGGTGFYWSSTELVNNSAWDLYFGNSGVTTDYFDGSRNYGFSVRCIAE
jgi:uncharacterized protein (TIGR02145 family)